MSEEPLVYPEEMTPELRNVLGRICYQLAPIANLFRAAGHDIKRRAEDEQAFVLHWMVKLVLRHGEKWQEAGETELRELRAALRARAPAPGSAAP